MAAGQKRPAAFLCPSRTSGGIETGDWKVARTRRQECLRYDAGFILPVAVAMMC